MKVAYALVLALPVIPRVSPCFRSIAPPDRQRSALRIMCGPPSLCLEWPAPCQLTESLKVSAHLAQKNCHRFPRVLLQAPLRTASTGFLLAECVRAGSQHDEIQEEGVPCG